jgi:hypothetical protein
MFHAPCYIEHVSQHGAQCPDEQCTIMTVVPATTVHTALERLSCLVQQAYTINRAQETSFLDTKTETDIAIGGIVGEVRELEAQRILDGQEIDSMQQQLVAYTVPQATYDRNKQQLDDMQRAKQLTKQAFVDSTLRIRDSEQQLAVLRAWQKKRVADVQELRQQNSKATIAIRELVRDRAGLVARLKRFPAQRDAMCSDGPTHARRVACTLVHPNRGGCVDTCAELEQYFFTWTPAERMFLSNTR